MTDKTIKKNIILIVDDNQNNLDVLFDLLKKSGFKVLVALNGESAIKQIERIHPTLILLDVMMPGIDGFETCRRLKTNPTTQDIPVIFMTALSETVNKVNGFQVGAVDYITKPFQYEEVLSRLKTHLTIRNLQNKLQEKNTELLQANDNLEKLVEQKTKQLIQQEKTAIIGRLTQGLFHNLRNPIQVILTTLSLIEIKAQETGDTVYLKNSEHISTAVNQINDIINTLMLKSRREQEEDLQLVNINELLRREIQLLEADFNFSNAIKKKYIFDDEIVSIPLIYCHISQIFHSLAENAIDAMSGGIVKELTIITRQDEQRIYIDVKDTGCGISPENLSKIFDPFYTTKLAKYEDMETGVTTRNGLGLYTCIELLKPFEGEITVTSDCENGSIFTVILPKNIKRFPL
ncbi:hybrid sensor histidine kinase/response regulator [Kamptonema sp. UHCC 0994]|uniref:hybrid sensor histidine kinase/response regulator n=1 Tax=Kamptonema sp. UHCC 0994 TaxID=3031329 RepID=UPI0023B9DB37|nr:hybrid sensor histidine kinase/response regulator [Kamptonema sp. UHCC 0994]MDF0555301.1 hybrid sensor histidine kinase/response regulator [Kamptonema sp. UHCC 0994]